MQDNQSNYQDKGSVRTHQFTDHELVAAFIEKRLTDNLAAFKKYLPEIYKTFKNYQEERFFLIYNQDGNINVFDKKEEKLIYADNPVKQALDNLDNYIQSPVQRPFFVTPTDVNNKDSVNYLHSGFMGHLADSQYRILKEIMVEDFKTIFSRKEKNNIFKLRDCINTIFIFSTGVGFDIEKLYFERKIRKLFLIEPCLDSFYISLQLIDWSGIIEKSLRENCKISFLIGNETIASLTAALSSSGRHNAAGSFLYSSFYLDEFKDVFKKVRNIISNSMLAGFGFYDDSRYSLAHTMGNIKNNIPLLSTNRTINKVLGQSNIPAFIIGNGPSLDKDIDFLRENQGKVVIYSCGSSLKALLENDIIPDYYIEMERTSIVTYFINQSSDGIEDYYDKIKNIKFIAVSQVDPVAFNFFDKKGMLLKDNETGSMLALKTFKDDNIPVIARLAPTCVHTGFTLAVIMGFKDIYLFGTDMGTLDPDKHHSKYSLYNKAKGQAAKNLAISKEGEVYHSNFDDKEVYSSGFYPISKHHLESVIGGWKSNYGDSLNIYNCSDGAILEGTEPKRAKDITISHQYTKTEKYELATQVFDAYFSFYPTDKYDIALKELEDIKQTINKACDWAISYIHPVSSLNEAFDHLDQFTTEFHSSEVLADDESWLYTVFDGSLLYAFSIINTAMQLSADDECLIKEFNLQLDSLKEFFKSIKKDFDENCLKWDQEERHAKFLGEDETSENLDAG